MSTEPLNTRDTTTQELVERILQLQETDEQAALALQAEHATQSPHPADHDDTASVDTASGGDKAGGPVGRVIAVARSQVGYRETPVNLTKYGQWYGWNGVPWCDIFVCWVFAQVGQPGAVGGKFAYVPAHREWFRRHNRLDRTPHPGSIVFFDWDADRGLDHIGIVVAVTPTHITTVEGNRNDAVTKVTYPRNSRYLAGFANPNW